MLLGLIQKTYIDTLNEAKEDHGQESYKFLGLLQSRIYIVMTHCRCSYGAEIYDSMT